MRSSAPASGESRGAVNAAAASTGAAVAASSADAGDNDAMPPRPGYVRGIVLAVRNPSYFVDDVRALRAVSPSTSDSATRLANAYGGLPPRNLLILSTKPDPATGRSAADAFAGGDYDGDDAVVLWGRGLVGSADPAENGTHDARAKPLSADDQWGQAEVHAEDDAPTVAGKLMHSFCAMRTAKNHLGRLVNEVRRSMLEDECRCGQRGTWVSSKRVQPDCRARAHLSCGCVAQVRHCYQFGGTSEPDVLALASIAFSQCEWPHKSQFDQMIVAKAKCSIRAPAMRGARPLIEEMKKRFALEQHAGDEAGKTEQHAKSNSIEFDSMLIGFAQDALKQVGGVKRLAKERRRLENYNTHVRTVMQSYRDEKEKWRSHIAERGPSRAACDAIDAADKQKREQLEERKALERKQFEALHSGREHGAALLYLAAHERWQKQLAGDEREKQDPVAEQPAKKQRSAASGSSIKLAQKKPSDAPWERKPSTAPWDIAGLDLMRLRLKLGPRATPI